MMLRRLLVLAALGFLLALPQPLTAPPVSAAESIVLHSDADIRDVQERLADLGWYSGAIDGIVGPATLSAANAYRRAAGLASAPRLDKELQLQLHFVKPDLRRGAAPAAPSDPEVRRAQELLKLLGYYTAAVDGIEGPRTRAAVRDFRQEGGLSGGEEVDQNLLQQLDREVGRRGSS